ERGTILWIVPRALIASDLRRDGFGFGHVNVRTALLDDGVEGLGVADGEFREHLAIELNAGADQGGDEAVVVDAALTKRRAEARDPEGAEMALFLATVAISVDVGLAGEFQRLAVLRAGGGAES